MIQVLQGGGPQCAVRFLAGARRGERAPRALQSAAARDLLEELRQRSNITEGPASKSHSRDLVAAAIAESGRVGVDVEFRAPGRRMDAIARYLMGAPATDEDACYRVFTFWEAYFKAFGAWPAKPLLRAAADAGEGRYRLDGGAHVVHAPVAEDFMLTLVWADD